MRGRNKIHEHHSSTDRVGLSRAIVLGLALTALGCGLLLLVAALVEGAL